MKYAKHIEKCVEQGRTWEAIAFAYDIGELITELCFKMDWERQALVGQGMLEAQGQAAICRRKQPAEERILFVHGKVSEGKSKRLAFDLAGRHFGVSASTIRKDYYKKRST